MITKKILSVVSSGACGSNFPLFHYVLQYFGYLKHILTISVLTAEEFHIVSHSLDLAQCSR